jgi:hypothetical protein
MRRGNFLASLFTGTLAVARAQRPAKASALDAAAVAVLLRKTSELYQQASPRCAFERRPHTPKWALLSLRSALG